VVEEGFWIFLAMIASEEKSMTKTNFEKKGLQKNNSLTGRSEK